MEKFSSADIDECADGTHNCIMEGPAPAECINTPGSFICSCDQHLGYQLQNSRCEGECIYVFILKFRARPFVMVLQYSVLSQFLNLA